MDMADEEQTQDLYDSSTVFYSLQFFYPKLLSRQVSLKTDALLF